MIVATSGHVDHGKTELIKAEHLAILDLLGIRNIIIVLTKIDRVPPEDLSAVCKQVNKDIGTMHCTPFVLPKELVLRL